jgi:ELWxxDGT repeat protein
VTFLAVCGLACGSAFADAGTPAALTYGRIVRLPDTTPGGLSTTSFVQAGSDIYFRAPSDGGSLWRSNGRPGGTMRLDTGVLYDPVAMNNGVVYLRSASSAGGPAGMCVIVQGSNSPVLVAADALQVPFVTSRIDSGNVKVAGTKVFFSRANGNTQTLWSWDCLSNAQELLTIPVLTGWDQAREVAVSGSKAFFITRNTRGSDGVYVSDGTAAGTARLSQSSLISYGSSTVPALAADNGRVYWIATATGSPGYKIWVSDGTAAGTHVVGAAPDANATSLWTVDGGQGVYWSGFVLDSGGTNAQLWHFGATAGAAEQLLNLSSVTAFLPLGSSNGASVFIDQVGAGGYYNTSTTSRTLWVTYGSQATTLVGPSGIVTASSFTQAPAIAGAPSPLTASANGEVYFARTSATSGTEVWHVNAATGSMGMMADLAPGTASVNPVRIFPMDHGQGVAVFAQSPAWRLWTISPGSSRVRYLEMATAPSSLAAPVSVGSRVFMVMSSTGGIEPWVADLCPADYDNSGTVGTEDLFAFLNDWLSGDPNASPDGLSPTMNDLLTFLSAWIVGCP